MKKPQKNAKKKNTKRKVKRDKHKIIKRNCNITTTILKGKSDDDNVKEEENEKEEVGEVK